MMPEPTVLPRAILMSELDALRREWPSMPKITVVDTVGDLPGDPKDPRCDAYHRNGYKDVFIVAGNIRSVEQLRRAVVHDCIFHYSLEEMLGGYGFAKLQDGLSKLKAAGDPTVLALAEDIAQRYGPLSPKDEAREIVAAAGVRCLDASGHVSIKYGFMKGIYAGVAGWLRDQGLSLSMTETELQGLLYEAGKWAEQPGIESAAEDSRSSKQGYVSSGCYSGRIVDVQDDHLVQKVGRAETDVVRHSFERLSGFAAKGDVVDIVYRDGRGDLTINGIELER